MIFSSILPSVIGYGLGVKLSVLVVCGQLVHHVLHRLCPLQGRSAIVERLPRNGFSDGDVKGFVPVLVHFVYKEQHGHVEFDAQTLAGEYPIFRYRQRDAFFRGFDLDTRYYVLPQRLYARLKGSMVWAEELKTGRYFPYIPALRLTEEVGLRLDLPKHWESELSVSHLFVDRQHRFDRSTDLTDSPDPYHLFGLEASLTKPLRGRQSLRLTLSVDNLFNTEYKEYTNRARYYAHDAGRDIRLALRWHF